MEGCCSMTPKLMLNCRGNRSPAQDPKTGGGEGVRLLSVQRRPTKSYRVPIWCGSCVFFLSKAVQ
jgi:hypothetical protein